MASKNGKYYVKKIRKSDSDGAKTITDLWRSHRKDSPPHEIEKECTLEVSSPL